MEFLEETFAAPSTPVRSRAGRTSPDDTATRQAEDDHTSAARSRAARGVEVGETALKVARWLSVVGEFAAEYGINRNEGRGVPDSAARAAVTVGGGYVAADVAGGLCGAGAVATVGALAPACVPIALGAGYGGSKLAGKAYDWAVPTTSDAVSDAFHWINKPRESPQPILAGYL
jgi:hypothetical protein